MPACHSSIVISGVLPVQEIGVIGVDLDCMHGLMQIVSPVPKHFDEGQEFAVIHIIVSLRIIHGLREECNWMHHILVIPLHEYGANGII